MINCLSLSPCDPVLITNMITAYEKLSEKIPENSFSSFFSNVLTLQLSLLKTSPGIYASAVQVF